MLVLLLILSVVVIGVLWRQRNARKKHRWLVLRQLRSWIGAQAASDPYLQRWVNGLSISEADVLVDLLTGYCTSLNWELTWLFTPHLQKAPNLKQAIEESVMAYARSILVSLQLVEEARVYNAYVALLQKPTDRKQFALVQKLYKALSDQGVIKPITPPWFHRQPTRKQKIAAVVAAFDREPAPAMATLNVLLTMAAMADVQEITGMLPRAIGATTMGAATVPAQ